MFYCLLLWLLILCSPWVTPTTNWTAVDDRVRGGSSQSHLSLLPNSTNIRFFGTLDTKTLGGAGFASQTTTGETVWDLSAYDGIQIEVVKSDGKTYTLIVKDEIPEEKREDEREKSSVSWEYDFTAGASESQADLNMRVWVPWGSFNATYRGREKKDAAPLKVREIKRFSLMMRRYLDHAIKCSKNANICHEASSKNKKGSLI